MGKEEPLPACYSSIETRADDARWPRDSKPISSFCRTFRSHGCLVYICTQGYN